MAIRELGNCLKATASLLPETLRKIIDITAQGSESTPPCLLYVILDFLLRDVLKEITGAEAERKHCEIILERLEPWLVRLSGKIFTILRVFGALACQWYIPGWDSCFPPTEPDCPSVELGAGHLVWVAIGEPEIFQQTLNLNHDDLAGERLVEPFMQIYRSLYRWLLAHHPPKKQCPTYVAVHQYTWAWAWDTYASQHPPKESGVDFVHNVDLTYACLRLILQEFGQPLNLVPPLVRRMLEHALEFLTSASDYIYVQHWLPFDFLELIEAIDFTSMLRALPDLTTTCCPRLFSLHRGLDALYSHLPSDGHPASPYWPGIPHYRAFLETVYSRLLQDPLASRVVPIMYGMFEELPSKSTVLLLGGLTPQELYCSGGLQGLFGVGFWEELDSRGGNLRVSNSLGALLKMGRVKLRPSQDNKSGYIDNYMGDAHEHLAFFCIAYLVFRTGPSGESHDRYANQYWSSHLERAKPSERLFEALRRVDICKYDIESVLQWLEESPNAPDDVLNRWRAARTHHGTINDPPWTRMFVS
ncbi:hypothetical protein BD779DRAFT_297962 [Infundibulicybe gibba]|nr:hypothetical protein BD779DRAFT_297962 [Infundibulicybe gibba]